MRVVQFWMGPKPKVVDESTAAWAGMPDVEYELHTLDDVPQRILDHAMRLWPDGDPYDQMAKFVSDLYRWHAVLGGALYADCDMIPIAPMREIVKDPSRDMLAQMRPDRPVAKAMPWAVMNGLFYCPEGSVLRSGMEMAVNSMAMIMDRPPRKIGHVTGPTLLSSLYETLSNPVILRNGVDIVTDGPAGPETAIVHRQGWRGRTNMQELNDARVRVQAR